MSPQVEKREFQAESREILDLMIHSIYSHKEIFLRELISNSSDALDKMRIEALQNSEMAAPDKPEVRLEADAAARTLTISDNGIGMNRDEVIANIGTIARSGTRELIRKLKEAGDKNSADGMIGQFGVGFYSVFMAADKVTLITRKAGDQAATVWESTGDGTYTITDGERSGHGTTIILHLKPADTENALDDFTKSYVIERVVKRYSDFINYPVILKEEIEEIEKDENGNPREGGAKTLKTVERTLNSMKPIWARPQSDVKPEEYAEFYKHISHDWNEPLKSFPFKAEGTLEFQSLLYLPSKAPFDFYYQGYKSGLQLYVKRVMIQEAFEDLLPHYLRFVRGVVESNDLPLNISREMLQQDRLVTLMRKRLTKKIIDTLSETLETEREKYNGFFAEFGNALKEGVTSDFENREKLTDLLLFQTSKEAGKLITLKEYSDSMSPDQKEIYYITGDNRETLEHSPHLEAFRKKGIDVLFLVDPVDEIVVNSIPEYAGKPLKSAAKGQVELGTETEREEERKNLEEKTKSMEGFISAIKDKLSARVKDVRLSSRLVEAPACIVSEENGMSPALEKFLKRTNMAAPEQKRILELNPGHALVKKLSERFTSDKGDETAGEAAELLLGYAYLADGSDVPDPLRFRELLVKTLERSL